MTHSTTVAATPQLLLQLSDRAIEGGAEAGTAGFGVQGAARAATGDRHSVGRLGLAGVQLVVQLDFVPGHAAVVAFEVTQPVSDLLSVEDGRLHVAAGNSDFRFSVDDGLRIVVDRVRARYESAGPVSRLSADRRSRELVRAQSSLRRTGWL